MARSLNSKSQTHDPWYSIVHFLSIIPGLLVIAACASPIRTEHDADPEADFARYGTYAWISEEPLLGPSPGVATARYVSPIDEQRIRRAVDAELASKGYRATAMSAADLVVSFAIGAQEKVRVQDAPGRSSGYVRGFGYRNWYTASPVRVRRYTEGTLAIELFDRESKQAVWVGWGSKRLSHEDESDDLIRRAVTAILAPLPGAGR